MKKQNYLSILLILLSLIGLGYIYIIEKGYLNQSPNTIWEKDFLVKEEKRASIEKVDIIEDLCNKVTLNISYNNLNNLTDGYYRITASQIPKDKNYEGYRGDHSVIINKGEGFVTYSNWITKDIESTVTDEIWVSIEEIVDKKFKSVVDRVQIRYIKNWEHTCENNS